MLRERVKGKGRKEAGSQKIEQEKQTWQQMARYSGTGGNK